MNWNVVNSSGDFSNRRFRADSDMSAEERSKMAQMRREAAGRPLEPRPPLPERNIFRTKPSDTASSSAAGNANNQSGSTQVVTNQDGDTFTPSNSATSQASVTSQASATSNTSSDFEQMRQQAHALNESRTVHTEGRPSFILGGLSSQVNNNIHETLFGIFWRMGMENSGQVASDLLDALGRDETRDAAIATIENLAHLHLGNGQDTVQFLADVYARADNTALALQGWRLPSSHQGHVGPIRPWEVWDGNDNGTWTIENMAHGRQFTQEEREQIVQEGNRAANQQQALRDLFASANLQFGADFFSQLTSLLRDNGMQSSLDWTLSIMSMLNQPTVINPTS
jgi:hypothetical protein